MVKKIFIYLTIIALCSSVSVFLAFTDVSGTPKEGDELPLIKLPVPESLEERNYFGLAEEGYFTIPKIKAHVLIIYFFSYYCPFCARQVLYVNELFHIIDKNQKLREKIKFIGIGIGNNPKEVNNFKEAHKLSFPLFTDTDFSIHKAYGEFMTPYFIILVIKEDGTHKIVYSKCGGFREVDNFLELIIKKSGI